MAPITVLLLAFVVGNVFVGVLIKRDMPLVLIALAAFGASWFLPDKQVPPGTAILGFAVPGLIIGMVGSELWDRTFHNTEQKAPPK